MSELKKIGRLALCEEGSNWNAYYALAGTMEVAIHLGSIRMACVRGKPERKHAFMDLMLEERKEAQTVEGRLADLMELEDVCVGRYRLSANDKAKIVAALRSQALVR